MFSIVRPASRATAHLSIRHPTSYANALTTVSLRTRGPARWHNSRRTGACSRGRGTSRLDRLDCFRIGGDTICARRWDCQTKSTVSAIAFLLPGTVRVRNPPAWS